MPRSKSYDPERCLHGHLRAENTGHRPNGKAYCIACRREQHARRRSRRPPAGGVAIYALAEPGQPWAIRYIGAAERPAQRYASLVYHCDHQPSRHYPVNGWLRELVATDRLPTLVILDRASTGEDWCELERFHIHAHQQAGFALLNVLHNGQPIKE